MSLQVVLGRGLRRASLPSSLPVAPLAAFLADPGTPRRVLVAGATADVAAVAARLPGVPLAFAGAPELVRLFALDGSAAAAARRLDAGVPYPADLGILEIGGDRHPFLSTVVTGAGSSGGFGFPWAGRRRPVEVAGDRRSLNALARSVVVANTQHWERWTVAPRAAINDSHLEIQAFAGSALALWSLRRALSLGLHGRHPGVTRIAVTHATVAVPASWTVRCDGIRVGRGGFRVHLESGAVTLLI